MTSPGCQKTKHNGWLFPSCYGKDLCCHLTYDSRKHGIQCMSCSVRIVSEMQPEIHTIENMIFLKSIT